MMLTSLAIVGAALTAPASGPRRAGFLDVKTQAAADRILEVARDNRLECFIGRGNERPNRLDYIVRYWR
jgi:hypothetical protein